jgi:hypothetical protein
VGDNPFRPEPPIPGFTSTPWGPDPRGYGKILTNQDEPGFETHLHRHRDGITISTYRPDGSRERFNLNTGREERGRPPR